MASSINPILLIYREATNNRYYYHSFGNSSIIHYQFSRSNNTYKRSMDGNRKELCLILLMLCVAYFHQGTILSILRSLACSNSSRIDRKER
jgi:hypothetical protein